jgi:hypothetical protein
VLLGGHERNGLPELVAFANVDRQFELIVELACWLYERARDLGLPDLSDRAVERLAADPDARDARMMAMGTHSKFVPAVVMPNIFPMFTA